MGPAPGLESGVLVYDYCLRAQEANSLLIPAERLAMDPEDFTFERALASECEAPSTLIFAFFVLVPVTVAP